MIGAFIQALAIRAKYLRCGYCYRQHPPHERPTHGASSSALAKHLHATKFLSSVFFKVGSEPREVLLIQSCSLPLHLLGLVIFPGLFCRYRLRRGHQPLGAIARRVFDEDELATGFALGFALGHFCQRGFTRWALRGIHAVLLSVIVTARVTRPFALPTAWLSPSTSSFDKVINLAR